MCGYSCAHHGMWMYVCIEQIELPVKPLDYFLMGNTSNISDTPLIDHLVMREFVSGPPSYRLRYINQYIVFLTSLFWSLSFPAVHDRCRFTLHDGSRQHFYTIALNCCLWNRDLFRESTAKYFRVCLSMVVILVWCAASITMHTMSAHTHSNKITDRYADIDVGKTQTQTQMHRSIHRHRPINPDTDTDPRRTPRHSLRDTGSDTDTFTWKKTQTKT